jgi:hypothetical protein
MKPICETWASELTGWCWGCRKSGARASRPLSRDRLPLATAEPRPYGPKGCRRYSGRDARAPSYRSGLKMAMPRGGKVVSI